MYLYMLGLEKNKLKIIKFKYFCLLRFRYYDRRLKDTHTYLRLDQLTATTLPMLKNVLSVCFASNILDTKVKLV